MSQTLTHSKLFKYFQAFAGTCIFAIAVKLLIVPLGLYNGGSVGLSQIIRTVLIDYAHISVLKKIDLAGIIYFIINVPLLFLAYKGVGKSFFIKTLIAVISQTTFLTLIPSPEVPIIDDTLAACLIGGIASGYGIGLALRAGGSTGGHDIVGVYLSKKYTNFKVGRVSMTVNFVVYSICAILFDIHVFIYSVIYATFSSLVIDRVHYQNIMVSVMIFTKMEGLQQEIMTNLNRGVTYWSGSGAYTNESTYVLVTAVSKYEVSTLKKLVHEFDPHAFTILSENTSIDGHFIKKL
ncbi:YitT family protein [Anaerosporobacter faecicola]|uniref:YitT family protein n=1 Tax=Anaerosporobacter faecicola TaxID=2718714 RepID=UPI00143C4D8B|nr:YitT family protein [Anaerosporobacter faecicola]